MFFSVITKNLSWEILIKNLVTFRKWDEVKDEKIEYYGDSLKNPIYRGTTSKGRAWTVCRFKGGGGLTKKGGWCF